MDRIAGFPEDACPTHQSKYNCRWRNRTKTFPAFPTFPTLAADAGNVGKDGIASIAAEETARFPASRDAVARGRLRECRE
jgi:hypothetical protein